MTTDVRTPREYRQVVASELTDDRRALVQEMVVTYRGDNYYLRTLATAARNGKHLDDGQILNVLNTARPLHETVLEAGKVTTTVTEPDIFGNYHEIEVEKHAWKCRDCGLVWAIKWHADTCAERGHVAHWQQRYAYGPVVNGVPAREAFYDRYALRREPVKATVHVPPAESHAAPPMAHAPRPQVKSGTYTLVNPATKGHRTIRIEEPNPDYWRDLKPGTRIAAFLSGPDNETNFTGFAFVDANGYAHVWKKYRNDSAIVAALDWLLKHGPSREAELAKAYAIISGRCGFCGRKLTTPESVSVGYGPICAKNNDLPWGHIAPTPRLAPSTRRYEELFGKDD